MTHAFDFDYAGHLFRQLAMAHDPGRPLQVELHPGLHCDRYQCPHCFGHGQRPLPGRALSAAEIAGALDEVAGGDPLLDVYARVARTIREPLARTFHSYAFGVLRRAAVLRGEPAPRLLTSAEQDAVVAALLQGDAECFVTFSLDAFNAADYGRLHAIQPGGAGRGEGTPGEAYFDRVCANIRALYDAKRRLGHRTQVRIAVLLFRENVADDIEARLEPLTGMADLVRLAVAQDRNDGGRVANLPEERGALLQGLAARFAGHPKVRVLVDTADPVRATSFDRCHTQRFQVTVDKSGNLYPCPQVAVAPYGHLAYGNLRAGSFARLLRSPERRRLFDQDVTTAMRCRVCDRKDEAINRALPAEAGGAAPPVRRAPGDHDVPPFPAAARRARAAGPERRPARRCG
jgi:radical SAM protein with 4Fe4S-binding SPASM domain